MTPDLSQTIQFFKILLGDHPRFCWQIFKDNDACTLQPMHKYGALKRNLKWLTENNEGGCGIFFLVNLGDGAGRSKNNIQKVRALFVDLDNAPVDPVMECEFPPTIITESSPGRFQAFWKCPDVPLELFTPIQKALAQKFGGDPAVSDLPRVMRVPGFYHMKREPFLTRIHHIGYETAIDYNELLYELKIEIEPPKKTSPPEKLFASDDLAIPHGQRHSTLISIAASLRNAGLSGQRLHEALVSENNARCKPPIPDNELIKISAWGMKIEGNTIKPARKETTKNIFTPINVMSWKELSKIDFPKHEWIIEDLLPQGLTILAGAPKVGKSWLVQHLCLSVAEGTQALQHFRSNQGEVLSLALEDTPQRFKSRMRVLNHGQEGPEDAYFSNDWPTMPEGITNLEQWISEHSRCRLIVIDTLQKFRPRGNKNEGIYEKDYGDMAILQKLAGKHRVGIILVHHQRKALAEDAYNSVSGSVGITGAADTVWILERKDRSKGQGILDISGRDISDRKYQLVWQSKAGLWEYAGSPQEFQIRSTQQKIINAIKEIGVPAGISQIANVIGITKQSVHRQVYKLYDEGIITKSAGQDKYLLSPDYENLGGI